MVFPAVGGAGRGPAGGLPRALDGTRRLFVVRPGRSKRRTVALGAGSWPYRDVSLGYHIRGGERRVIEGDGRGRLRTPGNGKGRPE